MIEEVELYALKRVLARVPGKWRDAQHKRIKGLWDPLWEVLEQLNSAKHEGPSGSVAVRFLYDLLSELASPIRPASWSVENIHACLGSQSLLWLRLYVVSCRMRQVFCESWMNPWKPWFPYEEWDQPSLCAAALAECTGTSSSTLVYESLDGRMTLRRSLQRIATEMAILRETRDERIVRLLHRPEDVSLTSVWDNLPKRHHHWAPQLQELIQIMGQSGEYLTTGRAPWRLQPDGKIRSS